MENVQQQIKDWVQETATKSLGQVHNMFDRICQPICVAMYGKQGGVGYGVAEDEERRTITLGYFGHKKCQLIKCYNTNKENKERRIKELRGGNQNTKVLAICVLDDGPNCHAPQLQYSHVCVCVCASNAPKPFSSFVLRAQ